jgi:uncharacterized lipoprotein NlpE involved in copper resistance
MLSRIYLMILIITSFLYLHGCDNRHETDKLVDLVVKNYKGPEVSVLEWYSTRGEEWDPLVIYFGYALNGNYEACMEEANRLNEKAGSARYRCTPYRSNQ